MSDKTILVFDIETIPDADALRALHGFSDAVSDAEVVAMSQRLRRQNGKSEFFAKPYHRIVVISCVLRHLGDTPGETKPLQVFSLAAPEYDEKAAIEMFYKIIAKYTPQLVSWNGGGFDLPVLHYRGMKHGVVAARFWQNDGVDDRGERMRFNNYLSRYHDRHLDLMDMLAFYSPSAWAGLDDVSRLCGLPGKIGIGGGKVYEAWQDGRLAEIINYCESDTLLTYLLYLRFQHFRGRLSSLAEEYEVVRENLIGEKWAEFLQKWESTCD